MDNIKILKNNTVYRVTDIVFRKGIRWQQDRERILTDKKYRNTILYDYLTKKKCENDLKTFKNVVKKHQKRYEVPEYTSLVIHLRLGDVMDESVNRDWRNYEKYKRVYGNLLLHPLLQSLSKAVIVTSLHFGANSINNKFFYSLQAKERSFEVLELLSSSLNGQGLKVSYKSSVNVDEDLCFMAGSRYFVKSFSGISELIVNCLSYGSYIWSLDTEEVFRKSHLNKLKKKINRL